MGTLGPGLFDGEDLICRDIGEPLNGAAGPCDLYFLDESVRAEAEVNARVAGARIAYGCRRFVPLRVAVGSGDFDLRANAHAVTSPAHKAQEKPVLAGVADVAEEFDGLIEAADDNINAAGVKDIAEGRATMRTRELKARAGAGADILELSIAEIAEDGVGLGVGLRRDGLLNVVHDIGASDEEVFPSVVVEVVDSVAPAGHAVGELTEAAGVVGVDEDAAALVDVERKALVLDGVVPDVGQSVVVDVAEVGAHAGEGVAIGRVSNAGRNGDLFEFLSADIVEEKVGHGVVGDKGIEKAIAIEVSEGDAHALAEEGVDAGLMRDVGEGSVAVVAIEGVMQRQVEVGMAVGAQALFESAVGILVDFPMAVVDDEKIEQPIVVVVEPARADGPHLLTMGVCSRDSGFGGDVSEGGVAVIAEKLVARDVCDKDVGVAVVVEVTNGNAHAIARSGYASFFSDVSECAVMVVAEKSIPVGRRRLFERGNLGAVDTVDIEEAVVVVVEQCDACNHRFRLVLVGCGAVAGDKVETGLFRDFFEANAGRIWECAGFQGKWPDATRRKRGCSDEAERFKKAAALDRRNLIICHGHLQGCVVTVKSMCSRRGNARSQSPYYCYRTPDHRIPDRRKENAQ
jgi:hypothetical protein